MKKSSSSVVSAEDYSLHTFRSSHLGSNAYVIEMINKIYVIDTGFNDENLVQFIDDCNKAVAAIFLTHAHFDHAGTAKEISERFRSPVFVLEGDESVLRQNNFLLMALRQKSKFKTPVCSTVTDGYAFDEFKFHSCPGHTPGSGLITFRDVVFTGDSVYANRISLVKLPGEEESLLRRSLQLHKSLLENSKVILPGHGPLTTGKRLFQENQQLNDFLLGLD